MWSRNKANLYIRDALNDFHYDPKALPSPIAQRKIYRHKLMLTHLVGFGGGGSASPITTKSYKLDGSGDKLTVPAPHSDWPSGTSDFTLDFWIYINVFYPNAGCGFFFIWEGEDRSFDYSYLANDTVGYSYTDRDEFRFLSTTNGSGSTTNLVVEETSSLNTEQWYHVMLSRSGSNWYQFLDGTQVGSTTSDAHSIHDPAVANNGLAIGFSSQGQFLNGYMDEIRISNVARKTSNFAVETTEYVSDANTGLLIHCNETKTGTTGSGATFTDSGNTGHTVTENGNAIEDTTIFKF